MPGVVFRGHDEFSVYCGDTLYFRPMSRRCRAYVYNLEHVYPCSVIATAFTLATTPTS